MKVRCALVFCPVGVPKGDQILPDAQNADGHGHVRLKIEAVDKSSAGVAVAVVGAARSGRGQDMLERETHRAARRAAKLSAELNSL